MRFTIFISQAVRSALDASSDEMANPATAARLADNLNKNMETIRGNKKAYIVKRLS
jgi:hypothetical protein